MMKINNHDFKFLTFLSMLYTTILLSSVLLDYKFIFIGRMLASSATFIISITFFLTDVIAEVYGYEKAKQVVWSGVACLIFFSCIGLLFETIPTPKQYNQYGYAYHIILNLLFRAGISNAIAIMLGAFFNIYFVSKWKVILKGKYFWLRSLCSSAFGEAIYTIFVVSLLNINIVSFSRFLQILLISYSFKLVFDAFAVIPASLLARFLKHSENVDIYDFPDHLSPFKNSYQANNQ